MRGVTNLLVYELEMYGHSQLSHSFPTKGTGARLGIVGFFIINATIDNKSIDAFS